jgi:D,D-heptose 1,7-bisphosphate phosphatase
MNRAVFLDKDGTLIKNIPYNVQPGRIVLQEGAGDCLRTLRTLGYHILCISNQAGVAKGYFSEADLLPVNDKINELLQAQQVSIDGFYYCPHHDKGTVAEYAVSCACRKPEPGLLLMAAADRNIDLRASWMIGDILSDTAAGNAAGCHTILLDNGGETEWKLTKENTPSFVVMHLRQAAGIIASMETVMKQQNV